MFVATPKCIENISTNQSRLMSPKSSVRYRDEPALADLRSCGASLESSFHRGLKERVIGIFKFVPDMIQGSTLVQAAARLSTSLSNRGASQGGEN